MTMAEGFERFLIAEVPAEIPEGLRVVFWRAWVAGAIHASNMIILAESPEDVTRAFGTVASAADEIVRSRVEVTVVPVGRRARRH